jgi:hypothetical protein
MFLRKLGFTVVHSEKRPRYFRLHINLGNDNPGIRPSIEAPISRVPVPDKIELQHHIRLGDPRKSLRHIGFCIYCGNPFFSTRSTGRPTDEHIIPQGLGGSLVLEDASCADCANIINKFEGDIQNNLLFEARKHLGVKGKNRGRRKSLSTRTPYVISTCHGKDSRIELELNNHPAIVTLPNLYGPGILIPQRTGFNGAFSSSVNQEKLAP